MSHMGHDVITMIITMITVLACYTDNSHNLSEAYERKMTVS